MTAASRQVYSYRAARFHVTRPREDPEKYRGIMYIRHPDHPEINPMRKDDSPENDLFLPRGPSFPATGAIHSRR